MATGFIDGDFPSGVGKCKFHCSPTCHPAQVGPDWKYGCLHPAFPSNRVHDFVPIVNCDGDFKKCELRGERCFAGYKGGLKRRIANAQKKLDALREEMKTNVEPFDAA